jgi:putative ABC transport system substrate-binding protein
VTRPGYVAFAALALLAVPGLLALAGDDDPPAAGPRIRLLFWHRSENDEIAARGLLRGLRIAGLAGDVEEFHADYDPSLARDAPSREAERARAEAAARTQLGRWREGGEVDLLVAMGTRAALIAAEEYERIPIVFTAVTNPAASGVTGKTGFAATGRNLTGNSSWIGMQRVLGLFRRAVPGLRRLGVVASPGNAVSRAEIEEARRFAATAKPPLEIVVREATTPEALAREAATLAPAIDALWIPIDDLAYRNVRAIREAVAKHGVPVLSSSRQAVRYGALLGLTCDYELLGMSAAEIVRKVLVEGKPPGSIPIGRLRTFDLTVNLESAGGRLPPEIVASADRILHAGDSR